MLTENQIQRAVFQHLRSRGAPGVFAFHPANGGFRRPIEAKILKGCGVLAGVPDIIALHNGTFFAIELKAMKGRPTVAQLECIDAIRNAGGHAVVCHGLDEALRVLESWGLLQGAIYNGEDDFAKSIDECYAEVRRRKAAGGPSWEPPNG